MYAQASTFVAGAAAAALLITAAFFVRFWRRTHDPLFAAFGIAFLFLAANQTLVALADVPVEYRSWVYLPKVAAFAVLIFAIIRKNVAQRSP